MMLADASALGVRALSVSYEAMQLDLAAEMARVWEFLGQAAPPRDGRRMERLGGHREADEADARSPARARAMRRARPDDLRDRLLNFDEANERLPTRARARARVAQNWTAPPGARGGFAGARARRGRGARAAGAAATGRGEGLLE